MDDLHSFTFTVYYANGKEIYATGQHAFPDNYDEVIEDVRSVFGGYENNK